MSNNVRMVNFTVVLLAILALIPQDVHAKISDKRLCANEDCSERISLAKTLLRYPSSGKGVLSVPQNVDVTVYSKSAGSNTDLWGIEFKGKRGYIHKNFLRETRVFKKSLPFLVDTELAEVDNVPSLDISPNKPKFEIVDGTTILLSPNDISPSATEENLQPTERVQDMQASIKDKSVDVEVLNKEEQDNKVEGDGNDKKEKSLVDSMFSTISNYLDGAKEDATKTDAISGENEDSAEMDNDDDSEENEADDQEDTEDEDDEDEDIAIEEENTNEVLLKIPKIYKENKTEEIEDQKETISSDKNNLVETNVKKEVVVDSFTSRSLLQEKESDQNKEHDENKKNYQNKDHQNKDHQNKDDQNKIIEEESTENVSIENVSSESIGVTTESVIDQPYNDFVFESVTANPGKIDIDEKRHESDKFQSDESKKGGDSERKDTNTEVKVTIEDNPLNLPKNENELNSIDPEKSETQPVESNVQFDTAEGNPLDNLINTLSSEKNPTIENIESQSLKEESDNLNDLDNRVHNTENPLNITEIQQDLILEKSQIVIENSESVDFENSQALQNESNSNDDLYIRRPVEEVTENSLDPKKSKTEAAENNVQFDTAEGNPPDNLINTLSSEKNPTIENIESQPLKGESNNLNDLDNPVEEVTEKPILVENDYEKEIENTIEMPSEHIPVDSSENVSEDYNLTENPTDNVFVNPSDVAPDNPMENVSENPTEYLTETLLGNSIENVSENPTENFPDDKNEEAGGLTGLYNSIFGGGENSAKIDESKDDESKQELGVTQKETKDLEKLEDTKTPPDNGNIVETEELNEVHQHQHNFWTRPSHPEEHDHHVHQEHDESSHDSTDHATCSIGGEDCSDILGTIQKQLDMDFSSINFTDILNLVTVLVITGITVVLFLLGYIAIDKSRRERPLIAKINKLEKALLVSTKEAQILNEKVTYSENYSTKEEDVKSSESYTNLRKDYVQILHSKVVLEDQVQSLEKELENSTEVGLELNRMLSEILSSQSGSETLVSNVETLQRQLVEQQSKISSINTTLSLKDTENHELQLELEIKNKTVIDLQGELDKMAMNLLKFEEEKDQNQLKLENELQAMKERLNALTTSYSGSKNKSSEEIASLKKRCVELQKSLDLKSSEYNILKENFKQIKTMKNNKDMLKDLLQCTTLKAEVIELQTDNKTLSDLLSQERQIKVALEQRTEMALKDMDEFKIRYEEADKEKLQAQTKLEVLSNYFKEKEAELQKELAKQEALWVEKQGDAASSNERYKYIQEELQNYRSQTEMLKQEIVSQEVELKSQISVLEKKAHECWLTARQAERRLEDAKQEAAQLRNRLTLKERSFTEDKGQHRIQSPLEQNGDVSSPMHMPVESPASPLLYSTRDHLTTSPPLPGLPPFLPPPPGVAHFMPPPMPGVPGFMPPPPSMFSVDHRPPPLGRMSSPPLNSRYSPDSRYSPYEDRNSPSPPPFDDDYRSHSPQRHRSYSPYRDDRRDYTKRTGTGGGRTNGRSKGVSSGSDNSNSESIDRTNRHHPNI